MKKDFSKNQERVIGYALCFLLANYDEEIEQDLGLDYEEIEKIILSTGFVKDR